MSISNTNSLGQLKGDLAAVPFRRQASQAGSGNSGFETLLGLSGANQTQAALPALAAPSADLLQNRAGLALAGLTQGQSPESLAEDPGVRQSIDRNARHPDELAARPAPAAASSQTPKCQESGFNQAEEAFIRQILDAAGPAAQAKPVKSLNKQPAARKPAQEKVEASLADNGPLKLEPGWQERLENLAKKQLGRDYRLGGDNPSTGFDCSGFTSWVYGKVGVDLPRNSREQFGEGKPVEKQDLKKGDLVFFGKKNRVSHVGIYLEDGKFIHSASLSDEVRISRLDESYWENRFAGARRML